MVRQINRLSALFIKKAGAGLHADGGGLYLQVASTGTKSWIFRYSADGRSRDMGLGSVLNVGLAEARKKALDCRRLREEGFDPILVRREQRKQSSAKNTDALTFDECRDRFIGTHSVTWKNEKHRKQWTNTLGAYCTPSFGFKPIDEIDVTDVMASLRPIWTTKPETASRIRGRIETILDWATAHGYFREIVRSGVFVIVARQTPRIFITVNMPPISMGPTSEIVHIVHIRNWQWLFDVPSRRLLIICASEIPDVQFTYVESSIQSLCKRTAPSVIGIN